MLDLFFRAETPVTLRTVIRSAPFRTVIGDLRDGSTGLRMLPGSVDWVYFPPDTVVITPGDPPTTDVWCWLHLRLTGLAEATDFEPDPADAEPDRWNKSRIRKWMLDNGTLKTIRGVRVYEHVLGTGKRIQIWRGSEMEAAGAKFHEFMGDRDLAGAQF